MTGSEQRTARRVVVHGRVQGVFFRDSCRQQAERLGVAGWVSNEPDGSVAGHFEGAPDAVEALVRWCRDGPPSARVERVDVQQAEPRGQDRFTVR